MRLMSYIVSTIASTTKCKGSLQSEESSKSYSDGSSHNDYVTARNYDHDIDLPHWKYYPNTYTVHMLNTQDLLVEKETSDGSTNKAQVPSPAFTIDGNIDKDVWRNIEWSKSFGDIQGYDEPEPKQVIPTTRFKALYDKNYLYVIAELHPALGLPTMAHYTQRNSPIYQMDSDFEIFIDVDHTTHMYKELEVNVINTIWNLLLDKPYDDGGVEHSGRIAQIGDPFYYDVNDQQTATKIISGIINDTTNNTGALWVVEMALSYKDILSNTTILEHDKYTPTNTTWKVNFSRVEKEGKINWTWQPQLRWNPTTLQYNGFVQMHLPESWGYFYFIDDSIENNNAADSNVYKDPMWPKKFTAMTIYYALHYYKDQHGHYTNSISDLIVPLEIIAPFCIDIQLVPEQKNNSSEKYTEGFLVRVYDTHNNNTTTTSNNEYGIQVRDDRLLTVVQKNEMNDESTTDS